MGRLNEFVSEDSNQFGPGTDLVIAMMGVLLVMILVSGQMYSRQKKQKEAAQTSHAQERKGFEELQRSYATLGRLYEELKVKESREQNATGNFKLASTQFLAGTFEARPVDRLRSTSATAELVGRIVEEYATLRSEFPVIFVIGHSNHLDDPDAEDTSPGAKLRRNWVYGARRAGVIAELIQSRLPPAQREDIVVVTTGEFDLKDPTDPLSQDNAVVEVVFGKGWKPPTRLLPTGGITQ
ncbi:MAG: hypothetical protein ABW208_03790 [Pyrinomonadaceae bacterium]